MRTRMLVLLALCIGLGCACAPAVGPGRAEIEANRSRDASRLQALWVQRTGTTVERLPIGPGDVIEISVPGLPELEERNVRVASDGSISVPLLGSIQAEGMTVRELTEDLRRRLEAGVMYDPSVNVFVSEYKSRLVGVIGAVENPGSYPIADESDTLLDLIAQAGGLNEYAAPRVYLIPDDMGVSPDLARPELVASGPSRDPIRIDLGAVANAHSSVHLLPVRPGDLIMVPERGEVLVQGWVKRPGAYAISPGLTVLGAVAAAGGTRFAARPGALRVMRQTEDGDKLSWRANLGKIETGVEDDFLLEAGDVIEVPSNPAKAAVTGVYSFLTTIFSVGFAIF